MEADSVDQARVLFSAEALRRQLHATGAASLRIRGGSMRPILPAGTAVELRPVVDDEDLEGTIVALNAGDRVVVHRVIESAGDRIETRGVASRQSDGPRHRSDVIGIVYRAEHIALANERRLRLHAAASTMLLSIYRRTRRRPR